MMKVAMDVPLRTLEVESGRRGALTGRQLTLCILGNDN